MDVVVLILFATLATLGRIWALIGLAIVAGWGLAFLSIRSRAFETIYVPVTNALESIPVISFLPIVLVVFVTHVGGFWGTEFAVDFLVFDAVAWNIWIGAYQSFKTVPENLGEVAENYSLGTLRTLRRLLIPHSIPRVTSNLFSSFADAFFYISVSEVFAIGIHSYATFGIGTLIVQFTQAGDGSDLLLALISIGIAVAAFTIALSYLTRRAVARYGLDTRGDVPTRPGQRTGRAPWIRAFGSPRRRISRYLNQTAQQRDSATWLPDPPLGSRVVLWGAMALLAAVFGYLLLGAYHIVVSVSPAVWSSLLGSTPFLLYAMGVDYVRVALVALASLGVAITLGYFLATHRRANVAVAPALQVVAAYPVPTYFPLVFAATVGFLSATLPLAYAEVYIFLLAFLSCFYYVFFDFWVGVQAIPAEFWEVMENHELSYTSRMRRVVLPATFPYLITGISSTINSCWAGLAIGEFWPAISGGHNLVAGVGMMKFIGSNLASGDITAAAWVSLLFACVVLVYGLLFTRNLMDVARRRYVIEEGVYAA